MPRTRSIALLVLLGAVLVGLARDRGRGNDPPTPCEAPLPWRVGEVDAQFDLSETELRQAVEEAVWVWETAVGRPLFRYDPGADMAVDLVYDARTDSHDRQRALRTELARLEESVDWHRRNLDRLRAEAQADSATHWRRPDAETAARYRTSVERFNRAVDLYNAAVLEHNEALQALQDAVPSDLSVGSLRSEERLRGGRVAATHRTVTIAYVGSHSELVLILTHELGHALGLGHVDAAGAVMAESYRHDDLDYPVRLRPADLDALQRLCGPGD